MNRSVIDLGLRNVWGGTTPLLLSAEDRARHLYIIGQTGVGKSTLIKNIFEQDMANGHGCCLIDPHGDLALESLDLVPRHRTDDVRLIDPSDIKRPVGFNPFYRVPKDEQPRVAGNIVATIKHVSADAWGHRTEHVLYNTIAAVLAAPDAMRPTFLSIPMVWVDRDYREDLLEHVTDERVLSFFYDEFDHWNERLLAEYLSSSQNKVGQFLSNPFVRNILGQWKPTIDVNEVMADQRILVVRLSKGLLGEAAANLLGSMIVSSLQQAGMRRADMPEQHRAPFHVHIDEFFNFTTNEFQSLLSECRKYGLTLTLGHQYIDQLPPAQASAIFGNVGNIVAFRSSNRDAERLSREIGDYQPATFSTLERGEVCVRLLENNEVAPGCLGRTAPPNPGNPDIGSNVLAQSRARFGSDREAVEANISRWISKKPRA